MANIRQPTQTSLAFFRCLGSGIYLFRYAVSSRLKQASWPSEPGTKWAGLSLHFSSAPVCVLASFCPLPKHLPCRGDGGRKLRCSNRQAQVHSIRGERVCLPVSIYKIPQNHYDQLSLSHVFHSRKVPVSKRKRHLDQPGQWGKELP